MNIFNIIISSLVLFYSLVGLAGNKIELSDKDIIINADAGGKYTLSLPLIIDKSGKKYEPTVTKMDTKSIDISYGNVAKSVLNIALSGNVLKYQFERLNDVEKTMTSLLIPFTSANGGKWALDSMSMTQFPSKLPEKYILCSKNSDKFAVRDMHGRGFVMTNSQKGYMQLQDNRKFNWRKFCLAIYTNLKKTKEQAVYTITIDFNKGIKKRIIVDKFGQSLVKDFPGKVKHEQELRDDVWRDKEYYSSLKPPALGKYYGMPGSKEVFNLRATGFFRLGRINDRDVLITPNGNIFFQLGVCSMGPCDDYTYIKGRHDIYQWIPEVNGKFKTAFMKGKGKSVLSYYLTNLIIKNGKPYNVEDWKGMMAKRLIKWGFNSQGAFGSPGRQTKALNFPYTPSLPIQKWWIPSVAGGTFDPYDKATRKKVDEMFKKHVAPYANEPLIIGYFIANEQHYSDIPRYLPQLSGKNAVKHELIKFLENKYSSVNAFNEAWKVNAKSFASAVNMSLPVNTKAAWKDMSVFTEKYLDEYFKIIHDTFRKYDKNHLIIGARFLPAMVNMETAAITCAKYSDIFSVNYYTNAIDEDFLVRVHALTGKPLLLSEWSFGTSEQGLAGGCRDVANQYIRGCAYRNYIERSAMLPFVVGVQWFACIDQALTGRWFQKYNGENMNIGLINVADRPFKKFLTEVMKTNYDIYSLILKKRSAYTYDAGRFINKKVERKLIQIPHALPGMKVDGVFAPWPNRPSDRISSKNLVTGKNTGGVSADFWLCWDVDNLYFYANVKDATPGMNKFTGKKVWKSDAIELFFGPQKLEKGGQLLFDDRQLIIAAAGKDNYHWFNSPSQYPVKYIVQIQSDGKGYCIEAAIPMKALGIKPVAGKTFLFDLGLDDGDNGPRRKRQFIWNGKAGNSAYRDNWGVAKLVN